MKHRKGHQLSLFVFRILVVFVGSHPQHQRAAMALPHTHDRNTAMHIVTRTSYQSGLSPGKNKYSPIEKEDICNRKNVCWDNDSDEWSSEPRLIADDCARSRKSCGNKDVIFVLRNIPRNAIKLDISESSFKKMEASNFTYFLALENAQSLKWDNIWNETNVVNLSTPITVEPLWCWTAVDLTRALEPKNYFT